MLKHLEHKGGKGQAGPIGAAELAWSKVAPEGARS